MQSKLWGLRHLSFCCLYGTSSLFIVCTSTSHSTSLTDKYKYIVFNTLMHKCTTWMCLCVHIKKSVQEKWQWQYSWLRSNYIFEFFFSFKKKKKLFEKGWFFPVKTNKYMMRKTYDDEILYKYFKKL